MTRVILLARGHGYGHAARDLHILRALRARPGVEVVLASSGTGLDYFASRGERCADLGLSDNQDLDLAATRKVLAYLAGAGRADLVVADELFCVPGICRGLRLRSLLLTDFFWADVGRPELDRAVVGAEAVLLVDFPEAHPNLPELPVPLRGLGPVASRIGLTRRQARARLGLDPGGLVATVAFGSVHGVKRPFTGPLLDTVLAAWAAHATSADVLNVLLPADQAGREQPSGPGAVNWVGITTEPRVHYRASDVVFAFPGLATLSELTRNAIPTVCFADPTLSWLAAHLHSAGLIQPVREDSSPDAVWHAARAALADAPELPDRAERPRWADPEQVADIILATARRPVAHSRR
ncbi:hypothetical protein [Pseudonocardia acaciae]|uniref:hypothetical protein n=1 Tax=Pseudonocardia acaciae TaxID=551276 RepID=UPI00048C4472|nr:hypothetical protein [Pseudonocardia acaciae]